MPTRWNQELIESDVTAVTSASLLTPTRLSKNKSENAPVRLSLACQPCVAFVALCRPILEALIRSVNAPASDFWKNFGKDRDRQLSTILKALRGHQIQRGREL